MKYGFIGLLVLSLTACETAQQILSGMNTGNGTLSGSEIAAGLKEALTIGTQNSSSRLSAVDGFFGNAAIKILMPEEAKKVESALRNIGLGSLVDKAVLSVNRAAEEASGSAAPIFVNAIKEMTAGKEIAVKESRSVGCTIKRNK